MNEVCTVTVDERGTVRVALRGDADPAVVAAAVLLRVAREGVRAEDVAAILRRLRAEEGVPTC